MDDLPSSCLHTIGRMMRPVRTLVVEGARGEERSLALSAPGIDARVCEGVGDEELRELLHGRTWDVLVIRQGVQSPVSELLRMAAAVRPSLPVIVVCDPGVAPEAGTLTGAFDIVAAEGLTEAVQRAAQVKGRCARLAEIATELARIENGERRRLARLLHDDLQQLLVGAKYSVGMARARARDEDLRLRLQQTEKLLAQALESSRSLSFEMGPPIPQEVGLPAALQGLGRWMREKHGLAVEVDQIDDPGGTGCEENDGVLFRLARELLRLLREAGAERARLQFERRGDDLLLTATDFGSASEAALRAGAVATAADGIQIWLELTGGRLEVNRTSARPRVSLVLPMTRAEEEAEARPSAPPEEKAARAPQQVAAVGRHVRVLLADDHQIVREGVMGLLQDEPDIEVVGEASDGLMAVEKALQIQPDVVVMDLSMPGLTGIEATRRILAERPNTRVVGLSMHEEADMAAAMREFGAVAYLTKDGSSDALIAAIRGERRSP